MKTLYIISLLFYLGVLYGQSRTDSLELALLNTENETEEAETIRELLYNYYANYDKISKFERFCDRLSALAQKYSQDDWKFDAIFYKAYVNKSLGNYVESLNGFDDVIEYSIRTQDTILTIRSMHLKASVLTRMGRNIEGLKITNEVLELAQLTKDTSKIIYGLNAKAIFHKVLFQFDEALETYFTAAKLCIKTNNIRSLGLVYHNLGSLYMKLPEWDSAVVYLNKAIRIDSLHNDGFGLMHDYLHRSSALTSLDRLIEAKVDLDKGLVLAQEYGDSILISESLLKKAKLHLRNKEYILGEKSVQQAIQIAERTKSWTPLKESYGMYSQIKFAQGETILAYDLLKKMIKVNEKIVSKNTSDKAVAVQKMYDAREKYAAKEKEVAIARLEASNAIQLLKTKRRGQLLIISVLGMLTLGVLLKRLSTLNKKNKAQNIVIQRALEDREILLKEIHHRVKNNLQVISSLLSLQSKSVKDEKAVQALNEGQSRVQSMALIHQDLYQTDNLLGVPVELYVRKLCQSLFATYRVDQKQIDLRLDVDDIDLDVSTLIPLGLILNELITNALKYAYVGKEGGILNIKLKELESGLILEVKDNGVGFSDFEHSDGFGHKLVRTFAKKLKASLEFEDQNGTSIRLFIKNYKIAA